MDQESYSAFEIEDPSFSESIHALNGRLKTVDLNTGDQDGYCKDGSKSKR